MSSSAHLFFSYAHDDAERLTPIHAQMQNVLERNLWLDKVGLERGIAWENTIKAAIDDSYGVIFAVTETFVTRKFILEKEIPWAMHAFKDKQGAQIFPILFDDVDLPDLLKTPFITYVIDARDGNLERVFEELKRVLPAAQAGMQPFVVDWPRLANFKGRDNQLIELHQKLIGDGRVGVKTKTAGLHGTGGIGKTQLAVEYAHRYRYHYPGGVYWLNAGADWRKEVAACAVNLDRSLIEKSDEEKALAFRDYLAAQGKDALLVLDNVDDPAEVTRREVAPKLTISELCGQTRARLLLTTRVQTLPTGFESVSVDVLKPDDARAVLLDAWVNGGRKDTADTNSLDVIAKTLGYLPLALRWIEAALRQLPDTTPAEVLVELKARGLDDLIRELQAGDIDIGTPEYHDRLVGSVLDWQMSQLKSANSPTLLALITAFGEAAIVPSERLRLMMGLPEKALVRPFPKAVKDLQAYSLMETLSEGTAFRLHPLTQRHVMKKLNANARLIQAVPSLVAAYREPETLDTQTQVRGFVAVIEDLRTTQMILMTSIDELDRLTRLLILEEPHFLVMQNGVQASYIVQQLRERAYHEGDDNLRDTCDNWLVDKRHLHHDGLRYPTSKALLRTLSLHTSSITGTLELSDGRFLSWSQDWTLRLWSASGNSLRSLEGHTNSINGALELSDGRFLSWSQDWTLRLWSASGDPLRSLEGHTNSINGAFELSDGRFLSWSADRTLRLWSASGNWLRSLEGHTNSVNGALELSDGRFLSWSLDRTLLLWTAKGNLLLSLGGHNGYIIGALELSDGRFLSWSDDSSLRLWSASGNPLQSLEGHKGYVRGALELSDGRFLSWSDDNSLRLWSASGNPLQSLEGHKGYVRGALELADGCLLSWSADNTLRLWSASGDPIRSLQGHTRSVTGALVLGDDEFLSWSADNTLRLWNTSGDLLRSLEGHTSSVTGALELADGRFLSWSQDRTLRLWSTSGNLLRSLEGHTRSVRGVVKLADERFLSWSADRTLRLWSTSGDLLQPLKGHTNSVTGALELADGRLLSWSADQSLRLWSISGDLLQSLKGHANFVTGALELADGRLLSWSADRTLRLWGASGDLLGSLEGHTNSITGALELTDSRFLSWSDDNSLRLWSANGAPLQSLKGHTRSVRGGLELADGRLLSWSSDHTLQLWSANGAPLQSLKGHTRTITGALELTDGRLLSWSIDHELQLWSARGHLLRSLKGHTKSVSGALELSDSRFLSWANDNTLRLWSSSGEEITTLEGHTGSVNGALVLTDGRIVSWSDDWKVRLWSKDGEPLAIYASDSAITCSTVTIDNKIVVGDEGGRVLFLTLEEGV